MTKSHSSRVRLLGTTALVVAGVIWAVLAYSLAPAVIAKAYRGESLTIFNRLITGQHNHSLTEYLARWSLLANKASFDLTLLGVCILLAVVVLTREASVEPSDPGGKIAMSRPRLFVVYALGAVILGGALSDLVRDTEHWPFSPYPMYSEPSPSKTLSVLRLFGVVQRSPLIEIQLDSGLYLQPFDNSRLGDALDYALRENTVREGVADCLTRYEALRQAGRHDGPPLVAMRLYRVTWTLDPSPSDLDHPDRKELLTEVAARREGGD